MQTGGVPDQCSLLSMRWKDVLPTIAGACVQLGSPLHEERNARDSYLELVYKSKSVSRRIDRGPPHTIRRSLKMYSTRCHAGQRLAADYAERLSACRALQPRGRLVRRRRWAIHLRRSWHRWGLLAEAGMT